MEKALSQLKQLRKGSFRELNPTSSRRSLLVALDA